jgi:hypothetical protein
MINIYITLILQMSHMDNLFSGPEEFHYSERSRQAIMRK